MPSPLTLLSPSLSRCLILKTDPRSAHYEGFGTVSCRMNNMYHSFMLQHWSGKIACNLAQCVRAEVMSVGSNCKDASQGKSQDFMLSHSALRLLEGSC